MAAKDTENTKVKQRGMRGYDLPHQSSPDTPLLTFNATPGYL
jgi:hypothetical protein